MVLGILNKGVCVVEPPNSGAAVVVVEVAAALMAEPKVGRLGDAAFVLKIDEFRADPNVGIAELVDVVVRLGACDVAVELLSENSGVFGGFIDEPNSGAGAGVEFAVTLLVVAALVSGALIESDFSGYCLSISLNCRM